MPLQENDTLGPYRIAGLLGEGGMGAVYRARDTRLGRDVAIKVLTNVAVGDRERIVRFEQEARAAGILNHPNLLTIFDVGTDPDGSPFLVSELLEGETLRSRLERGPLSARKAVDAALQMAQGLAAAHEKGIVHRDLKPDNIFLTRDGRLKILDFGIAKLSPAASGETFQMAATEPGIVLGTVGYMSPEQVRGEQVDQRSDLFSLGAIFYEMLSGIRAFKRNSSIETLSAILREEPPDLTEMLPSIPPALERMVRRCLEKDREQRFQSARDLAFNLETLSAMSSGGTLSNVVRPPVPNAPTLRQAAAGAAAPAPGTHTAATAIQHDAAHAVRATSARPAFQPRRTVSPALLALLFLVSIAGAAYGGWVWAQRHVEKPPEPRFDRMTFRRGEVRAARFSPDGETIVYSAAWDGQPSQTFVASRRATEARPLGVEDSEVLAVSKAAELAILLHRDRLTGLGTLARIPLAGGMPRPITENVLQADWSPDGNNLAVIREVNGNRRVEYPIGTVRYETPHYLRDVRIAPDGRRLAILEPSRGEFEVAIIDGGKPVTIARGWPRGATGLAWSPDGKELWVSGATDEAPPALWAVSASGESDMRLISRLTGSIRIFDLSSKGEALLANGNWRAALMWKPSGTPQPVETTASADPAGDSAAPQTASAAPPPSAPEQDASWLDWSNLADLSADGKSILFSETREGGGAKSAVYLRQWGAPAPVRLGEGIGDALSPDGKWVLGHQGAKLMLLPTGTGEARELKIDGTFESGAAWLPDSRRVIVGGAVGGGAYRLYLLDTLDETAKPITPENIWNGGTRAFAVSPDGRFVAGMSSGGTIVIYPLDGSAAVPVPGVEKEEIPISWSADGAALFVYKPTSLPARVSRISLPSGAREEWKEFQPSDPAGVYKIAPVLVSPDGQAWAYNAMRNVSELYVANGLQ